VKGSPPHLVFEKEPEKVPDHHVFNENLNLMLLGEKGLGKGYLLKYTSELQNDCKYLYLEKNINLWWFIDLYFNGANKEIKQLLYEVKFGKNHDFELAKGILPLADQSFCLIDGIEKVPRAHLSILEVIDREKLTIASDSLNIELDVKTTIIASADPKNQKLK
jgi:DNA replicative helicase MCM subunit Mcm2 (Cdc46/Mcm family)